MLDHTMLKELGIRTMDDGLAILKLTNELSASPEQLLLHCWLSDSIPSQPIFYKPHPKWVVVAQHSEEILHHHNSKIVERYNKYIHNFAPLQAGDTVAI